jgi:hypothetical protein
MSSTHRQEGGTRLSAQPRKWTYVSTNHHTRKSVGDPKKSDITSNNRFEVLSNLNGSTDYNHIEIGSSILLLHQGSIVYTLKHQRQNITVRKYLLISIDVMFGDRMLVQLES